MASCSTESPEAIEAAKLYQRLMTKSAPPGVSGFNWAEAQSAFLQGKIGMWFDGVGFAPPIENPEKSRVVGKVGYGVMPKGPKAQAAGTFGDGIGVDAASEKKEAAYLFCQWAVSPEMGARLLQAGAGVPFRKSVLEDPKVREGVTMPASWLDAVVGSGKISRLALPVIIPVTEFRDIYRRRADQHDRRRRSGSRAEEGDRSSSSRCWRRARKADGRDARPERPQCKTSGHRREPADRLAPNYWPFVIPALVVVWRRHRLSLGVHPVDERQPLDARPVAGLCRDWTIICGSGGDLRFWESLVAYAWSTRSLSVVAPLFLGTLAALIFDAQFPLRGLLRGIFVMPMMATPVAIALVWTMMFHPQLGVLNYLLSLVGIPAQEWIFNPNTVIPSLVAVETWQWTPLVMLIVLGGLASVPREPFESAEIDGANAWQKFRYLTLPMIAPFLMVAVIIRTIDALKSFDIIYAMTQGGPGTASETINIYLYNTAFSYYDIGYGSAMAVVFFIIIVALSFILLMLRQRAQWSDAEGR